MALFSSSCYRLTLFDDILSLLDVQCLLCRLEVSLGLVLLPPHGSFHGWQWVSQILLVFESASVLCQVLVEVLGSVVEFGVRDPCDGHISLEVVDLFDLFLYGLDVLPVE